MQVYFASCGFLFKTAISFFTFGMKTKAATWRSTPHIIFPLARPQPLTTVSPWKTLLPQQGTAQLPSCLSWQTLLRPPNLHPPLHPTALRTSWARSFCVVGSILCVAGRSAASLVSTRQRPAALSHPPNPKRLPALTNVLGPELSLIRTTIPYYRGFRKAQGCPAENRISQYGPRQ